jgi:hypothetical protein
MELDEIRGAFLVLHGEATQLLSEVLRPRSRWTLVIWRWQSRQLENQVVALSHRFEVLDAQLIRHVKLPRDYDSAIRTTATFDLYDAVRDAVRGRLSDTRMALDSLQNRARSESLLAVLVIALAVAIGLVVAIVSLFV